MITIQTGEYEIISSGLFHALSDKETTLSVTDLKLVFVFEDNGNVKPELKVSVINNKQVKFTYVNFTNPLGSGNTELMKIGKFNEKEMFFSYRISSLDDKRIRTFEYTLYKKI